MTEDPLIVRKRLDRAARLEERLAQAFPLTPLPARTPPHVSNDDDWCDAAFGGRRWDEVDEETVSGNGECFYYFTAEQARYYLPAFLRCALRRLPGEIGTGDAIFTSAFSGAVRTGTTGAGFPLVLDAAQRRCVAEFLFLLSEWSWPSGLNEDDARRARAAAQAWIGDTGGPYDIEGELPEALRQERRALVAEIRDVFVGVMRGPGVSWRETVELDLRGGHEAQREARRLDPDRPWEELLDDPTWNPEPDVGGWAWLDPLGVRYYLPPAMIRCVREGSDWPLEYFLFVPEWQDGADLPERFAALSFRQLKVVGQFVRSMAASLPADAAFARWREVAASEFWQTVDAWPE